MNEKTVEIKDMGIVERFLGIFTAPKETFESINQKPNWVVPFVIVVLLAIAMNYFLMDIGLQDQIARMQARGVPQERLDIMQEKMAGPLKYVNIIAIPIVTLVIWSIISALLLFGCNTLLGSETKFNKIFSIIGWSSMVGILGGLVKTVIITTKETTIGVTTSLAFLLPTPSLDKSPSLLYRIFSKLDLFIVWQMALWIIGLTIVTKLSIKKTTSLVLALWALWIIFSITIGSIFGGGFGS